MAVQQPSCTHLHESARQSSGHGLRGYGLTHPRPIKPHCRQGDSENKKAAPYIARSPKASRTQTLPFGTRRPAWQRLSCARWVSGGCCPGRAHSAATTTCSPLSDCHTQFEASVFEAYLQQVLNTWPGCQIWKVFLRNPEKCTELHVNLRKSGQAEQSKPFFGFWISGRAKAKVVDDELRLWIICRQRRNLINVLQQSLESHDTNRCAKLASSCIHFSADRVCHFLVCRPQVGIESDCCTSQPSLVRRRRP
jgi:hypothetical protein